MRPVVLQMGVTLDGFVRHPGEYECTPGMRLSQLLGTDRLLPDDRRGARKDFRALREKADEIRDG